MLAVKKRFVKVGLSRRMLLDHIVTGTPCMHMQLSQEPCAQYCSGRHAALAKSTYFLRALNFQPPRHCFLAFFCRPP